MACRSRWARDLAVFCLVQKVSESGICKKKTGFRDVYAHPFSYFQDFVMF